MSLATLERERAAKVEAFADEYPFAPHFHQLEGDLGLHYVDEGPRDADPNPSRVYRADTRGKCA